MMTTSDIQSQLFSSHLDPGLNLNLVWCQYQKFLNYMEKKHLLPALRARSLLFTFLWIVPTSLAEANAPCARIVLFRTYADTSGFSNTKLARAAAHSKHITMWTTSLHITSNCLSSNCGTWVFKARWDRRATTIIVNGGKPYSKLPSTFRIQLEIKHDSDLSRNGRSTDNICGIHITTHKKSHNRKSTLSSTEFQTIEAKFERNIWRKIKRVFAYPWHSQVYNWQMHIKAKPFNLVPTHTHSRWFFSAFEMSRFKNCEASKNTSESNNWISHMILPCPSPRRRDDHHPNVQISEIRRATDIRQTSSSSVCHPPSSSKTRSLITSAWQGWTLSEEFAPYWPLFPESKSSWWLHNTSCSTFLQCRSFACSRSYSRRLPSLDETWITHRQLWAYNLVASSEAKTWHVET